MKTNFLGRIAQYFINQFQMAILIILLITVIGIFGFVTLPKESLPEIILPTLTIQGLYPGASPEDVEGFVVDKIEAVLLEVDAIDEVTSDSNFGIGRVVVNFIEGTDIDFKKLEIDNLLKSVNFPEGVTQIESSIFKTSEIPLMTISVSGERDLINLTDIGEALKEEIEAIPSIENVNIFGTVEKEIHIIVNHIKMLELGLTFDDVRNALASMNVEQPVGALDLNGIHYNLKVDESLTSINMIKNTLVSGSSGKMVFISDFAEVRTATEEVTEFSQTYVDDKMVPSIFLSVIRKADSDVIGTSEKVRQVVAEGKGDIYQNDIYINYTSDLSDSVKTDLADIQESALSGLVAVILVLYLFVGLKQALIVSISIPLSLLATVGTLNFFGLTFNAFVVLGLIVALGLLVDNSIIVMENINRLNLLDYPIKNAAIAGTNQVALPILAATLTTLAAFFPLAILPGTLGDFVSTIPITIMITLVMSLIVSIVITPTLSVQFFSKLKSRRLKTKTRFAEQSKIIKRYKGFMNAVLVSRWKKVFLLLSGICILMASFGLFGIGLLKVSFFPQAEPDSITIAVEASGGTTLEETAEIVGAIEEVLIAIPDIDSFNTTVGGDEINKARIRVSFKKMPSVSGFEIREQIEQELDLIPGAEKFIQTMSQGPPVGRPISIKIKGESLEDTRRISNAYKKILTAIEGVYNTELSIKQGVPQMYIDVNERKAQVYGLTTQSIATQIRGQLEGIVATSIRENRNRVDVVIKKSERSITEKVEIENLFVSTQTGVMLPLRSIASIRELEDVSSIKHEDGDRVVFVEADLKKGVNINDVISQFNDARKLVSLPDGITIQIGGDIEGIQESFIDLFQSMILAIFLVFIILTVQFRSIAQPFVILLTVPMAIIGVFWGLTITGNDFGFYAFMALVALVGIAVNDAIVLMDYTNYLRKEGHSLKESIIEAGITRFNPVLATTMTTIFGVLPLGFKDVYYAQFCFALVFGLLVTTILTLVFIPIIYSIIEGIKQHCSEKRQGGALSEDL